MAKMKLFSGKAGQGLENDLNLKFAIGSILGNCFEATLRPSLYKKLYKVSFVWDSLENVRLF